MALSVGMGFTPSPPILSPKSLSVTSACCGLVGVWGVVDWTPSNTHTFLSLSLSLSCHLLSSVLPLPLVVVLFLHLGLGPLRV